MIEKWFTDRLLPLMVAGRDDPQSFYHRFREWDDAARRDFAKRVWEGINLPNLRDHIVRDRGEGRGGEQDEQSGQQADHERTVTDSMP